MIVQHVNIIIFLSSEPGGQLGGRHGAVKDMRVRCSTVILAASLCCSGAQRIWADDGSVVREQIRRYRAAHEQEIVGELVDLLSIPNHASDTENIERNARTIVSMMERRNVTAQLLRVSGAPPLVYGELRAPGDRPTIGIYAHYDGQPAVPAQWRHPPFRPVLIDPGSHEVDWRSRRQYEPESRLYARSASDDKAPIQAILTALDALKSTGRALSVNLKLLFEGEEEINSPHLGELLSRHPEALEADVWLLSDGPIHPSRRMQVFFGVRGEIDLEMTVYAATRALHSGHYGNWAPNPIMLLTHLLDSMRSEDGQILIPHFSDDVRPLTDAEKQAVLKTPAVDEDLKHELAIATPEGDGVPLAEQILKPALNVHGIQGGNVGAQAANIISTEAMASIDFRLVPNQTPEGVRAAVEDHIARQGFLIVHGTPDLATRRAHPRVVTLLWGPGYPAYRAPMDSPVARAVVRGIEQACGSPIVELVSVGAAIPMYVFEGKHHRPVIGVPIANHDNNQHAADENLRLQNLWDAIDMYSVLLLGLGNDKSLETPH